MDLQLNTTKLTRVCDIKVPDIFNRRLKTGITKIDALFDEGILPGGAMTLTAKAGCGKTTFMLQLLDGMTKNGYKVGYFSGEESIYQLAYTANRINATQVSIANETDIDTICKYMEELDLIVVDSFQALTTKKKLNSRALEKYAVQHLTKKAKETECCVVFIMHLTKSGDLKGGTIVPHTVDANLKIDRVTDVDDEGARVIYFEKNRFGPLNELECIIGRGGYDFDAQVVREEEPTKVASKSDRKQAEYDALLDKLSDSPGIDISELSSVMEFNYNKTYSRVRELIAMKRVEKTGRGANASYNITADNTVRFAAQSK
jgi:molybdopterin-guanine dinucleotide biosynthesis protein